MLHRAINRRFQVLDDKESRMRNAVRKRMEAFALSRMALENRLRYFDVRPKLERDRNRLDVLRAGLARTAERSIEARRRRLENGLARLEQLSPLRVLERGYAIVQKKSGGIVKDPAAVELGTALEIRLARGILKAESK
jgi:exodeoxyribonuclease VII large subunit